MITFGLFFYWLAWVFWIIVIFFMKKSKQQTFFSYGILMLIIFSNKYIMIGHFNLSISYLMLLAGSLYMYTKLNRQIYHLLISFTVMIGYSAILIWKNSTPLWLFIHELLFIPFVCSFLIIILSTGLYNRLITGILGITAGQLLYNLILSSYDLNQKIGDLHFFDQLFITLIFLIIIHFIQVAIRKLYSLLDAYHLKLNTQKVNDFKKLS